MAFKWSKILIIFLKRFVDKISHEKVRLFLSARLTYHSPDPPFPFLIEPTMVCSMKSDNSDYRGFLNITRSGRKCSDWNAQVGTSKRDHNPTE